MNVAESGRDREVWRNWGKSFVDSEDVLGLRVEGVVVDILVVDTVLLTTGDTDFLDSISAHVLKPIVLKTYHLEPLLHWRSTLEVLGSGLNVEVDLLLTQIDHVGGEERFAVLLKVSLIGIKKAVQPWEELLGAMVGVKDDWNTIRGSNGANVVGTGNTTGDRCLLLAIGNTLFYVCQNFQLTPKNCVFVPFRRSMRHRLGTFAE